MKQIKHVKIWWKALCCCSCVRYRYDIKRRNKFQCLWKSYFFYFFYSAITYPLLTESPFAIRCMFTSFISINISFCILVYIPSFKPDTFRAYVWFYLKASSSIRLTFYSLKKAKRKRQHHSIRECYHFPVFFSMSWVCDKKPLFTMQMYGRQNAYLKHMAAIRIRMMLSYGFHISAWKRCLHSRMQPLSNTLFLSFFTFASCSPVYLDIRGFQVIRVFPYVPQ